MTREKHRKSLKKDQFTDTSSLIHGLKLIKVYMPVNSLANEIIR